MSPSTIGMLNKKAYVHIEDWQNRPLQGGKYPYAYVDGIYLRRNWGCGCENVAILVAIVSRIKLHIPANTMYRDEYNRKTVECKTRLFTDLSDKKQ